MNEHQIKDRINKLEFEIEHLKKRKTECGMDENCIHQVSNEIRIREAEIRDLKFGNVEQIEKAIDSDNNDYRERIYGEGDE